MRSRRGNIRRAVATIVIGLMIGALEPAARGQDVDADHPNVRPSDQPAQATPAPRAKKAPANDAKAAPPAKAQPTPAPPAANATPATPPPASAESAPVPSLPAGAPSEPVDEMQPLLHARNAGVSTCLDNLTRETSLAIDGAHDAFSTWSKVAPNDHPFVSIVALRYQNQTVPRAAAILVASPNPGRGCDGVTVQVAPTAQSCGAIQAALLKDGKVIANLTGLPQIENQVGMRHLLLPSAGNGCAIVVIGAFLSK